MSNKEGCLATQLVSEWSRVYPILFQEAEEASAEYWKDVLKGFDGFMIHDIS